MSACRQGDAGRRNVRTRDAAPGGRREPHDLSGTAPPSPRIQGDPVPRRTPNTPLYPARMDLVIGPLDLSAHVDEALAVQAVAFGLGADEVAVRRQIVLRHMTYPGARALGATVDGALVGFVYGMPNDRTHWWSTVVEPYLRAQHNDIWLDDSFVITELHVHPHHQNRGSSRRTGQIWLSVAPSYSSPFFIT